jgi:hypothetical protein
MKMGNVLPKLVVSNTFLFCHLFNEGGQCIVKLLKDGKLNETLLKLIPMCSLNIRNLISLVKHHLGKMGSIDSILTSKARTTTFRIIIILDNRLGKMLKDDCGVYLLK